MPDIFLSYSRDDQATARRFAEGFERAGFSVWWDATLKPGEAYDEVTEKALQEARAVVVLWSRTSVASRWVRAEATQAHRNNTLVPAMIEPCVRPIMFDLTHTTDLAHWAGDANDTVWQSFLAGVRRYVEPGSAATVSTPVVPRARSVSGLLIAIPVALLAVAGVALWMFSSQRSELPLPDAAGGASVAGSPAATSTAGVTLAVLPFADMSPAHDHEYFSDGLTEELLNQLAQVKALRVTARTSSFSFKGRNEDLRVIGQKLGVANILEGSVRKDGNQLRITAQLINSRDGAHLWSKTYDRELSGVFALQEEVAKDVAKALSITLDVSDLPRVQGGTTDVVAYDKYLQARDLYLQGGRVAALEAVQRLREAVALDPRFSRAWLSLVYALPETLIGIPNDESASVRRDIAAAVEQVLKLAPDTWWAKALRASQYMQQRQWAQAEAALTEARAAAEASSALSELNDVHANFLMRVGRVSEAAQLLEQSRQLNPLSLTVSSELQIWLDSAGRSADAEAEYQRSKDLTGIHQRSNIFALMRVLARQDADPAAIRSGFRTILADERLPMPLTHALVGNFSNREQARAAINDAISDPANQDQVRMTVVSMYADGFREKDLALVALRRSVIDFRSDSAIWRGSISGLRADARFKDILRDVGLADYFRSSGNWGDFCKPVGADDFECS